MQIGTIHSVWVRREEVEGEVRSRWKRKKQYSPSYQSVKKASENMTEDLQKKEIGEKLQLYFTGGDRGISKININSDVVSRGEVGRG
ncbi:hypothetical protein L6452_17293 [Arctium lappa]|uniref:Uncharacterized protein n=1 Tax=Arctium lappa TaxID=4217 RepID=A0ACB9C302_ARCLA|nr:hypothetical protein L6452_17293 [Arctium lappa]